MQTNASHESPARHSRVQRVLDEGARPLLVAAGDAGLRAAALPSLKTLLRAAISGKLEAVKVAGRWLTSPPAVRRWIEAEQHRRERYGAAAELDAAAADAVLDAHGLPRKRADSPPAESA